MSGMDLHLVAGGAAGGAAAPGSGARRPELKRLIATKGRAIVVANARELCRGNDGVCDELMSLGFEVLTTRAPSFDPTQGVRFSTYVYPYVRGAMLDALRRQQRETSIRRSITREVRRFGATTEEQFDALSDPDDKTLTELETYAQCLAAATFAALTAEAMLEGTEQARIERRNHAAAVAAVQDVVTKMSDVDQRIYDLYYCSEPKMTLKQVGDALGVSLISARRYHQAFLERLQRMLSERGIHEMPWMP
jgi:RNA polymerase sigma factor (sigma-70 family)